LPAVRASQAATISSSRSTSCRGSLSNSKLPSHLQQPIGKVKAMKNLSLALLLMASMVFVLSGCSDNSNSVVTPSEQVTAATTSSLFRRST
jgi:hypothetical protein